MKEKVGRRSGPADWLLLALFLPLLALLAPACRRAAGGEAKVRLVLAVSGDKRVQFIFEETVARFQERHPEIAVELLVVPGHSSRYYQKMTVMVAGRTAPDLMWMGQSFAEFAGRGAFLDLSSRLRPEDTADIQPDALSWYNFGGKQYGVPYGLDLNFIAFDRDLFAAAGVPPPDDDWDYAGFLERARRMTVPRRDEDNRERDDWRYGFSGELGRASFDADFVSADGERATCDTPEMLEFVRANRELVAAGIMPRPDDLTHQAAGLPPVELLRQHRAAMIEMYTWNIRELVEKCGGLDWDIVRPPRVRRNASWASSGAIVVSAGCRHPDEAWALCREFFAPEFQRAMSFRQLPSGRALAEEWRRGHRGPPANLQSLFVAAGWRGEPASLCPTRRVRNLEEMRDLWLRARDDVLADRAAPEEAMQRAQRQIARVIERNREEAP